MNFDCPHCKGVFDARSALDTHCTGGIKKRLCEVSLLPFPNNLDDYRARAFYIAKSISDELAVDVAGIFYDYNPKGALSKEEVITLLTTLSPKHDWMQLFRGESERIGNESLYKVTKLFKILRVTDTPSFIWVTSDDARIIPTIHDPTKRLDSVVKFLGKMR